MVFEEFPGHLPGELSADMMDNMFDLPDPRFSLDAASLHDQNRADDKHDLTASPPHGASAEEGGSIHEPHISRVNSVPAGPQLRRVHSTSLSSNNSQRSGSISSSYELRARHSSAFSENDDSGIDPTIFYSPALAPSIDGTPLMSPHDAPFVTEVFGDFAIPPAYVESPVASPLLNPQKRKIKSAGRVVKHSPQLRARIRRSSLTGVARSAHTSPDKPEDDMTELMMPPGAEPQTVTSGAPASQVAVTPATLMDMQYAGREDRQPSYSEGQRPDPPVSKRSPSVELHRTASAPSSRHSSVQPSPATTPILAPALQQRQASVRPGGNTAARHNRLRTTPISPAMSANNAQSEQDLASLLANKSNIQGMMEGMHQQMGLQYSDKLTTDLSTKKTTHKIAEQERRNRMNSALVELNKLVAPAITQMSKAATVEAAIDYIRDANERIAKLEAKLAKQSS